MFRRDGARGCGMSSADVRNSGRDGRAYRAAKAMELALVAARWR